VTQQKKKAVGNVVEDVENEEVGNKVSLKNEPSPIDILLSLDENSLKVEESLYIKRLKMDWRVRSVVYDEFRTIADRSLEASVGKNGRRLVNTDEQLSQLLLIYYGSVDPDLHDERLYQKYGINKLEPEELIKKILLPGEIAAVSALIQKMSGFDDIFKQFSEAAENLS